jgi:hypothetical protein
VVLLRDLLRSQVLLDGHRVVGAPLDRGVVGDHHHFLPRDAPDARDDARGRHVPVVHPVRGERRELQEGGIGVEQALDALACGEFSALDVPLPSALAAASTGLGRALAQLGEELVVGSSVRGELVAARVHESL